MGHYALEVVGRDGDVGIVDEQVFMTGVLRKLDEGADFAIGAEVRRTFDQTNGVVWKFLLQFEHRRGGRVAEG